MGYTTEFKGQFDLDRPLDGKLHTFLTKFSETRRMARNLPPEYGVEGEFYVDGDDTFVIDYNRPPRTQPGLWCGWIPNPEGTAIVWDGIEKFYYYTKWLKYIIDNFLEPNQYKLNGAVKWRGEDFDDVGTIVIKDNKIEVNKNE